MTEKSEFVLGNENSWSFRIQKLHTLSNDSSNHKLPQQWSQMIEIKQNVSFSDDEEFKPTRPCGWGRGTETSQVSFIKKKIFLFSNGKQGFVYAILIFFSFEKEGQPDIQVIKKE